MSHSAVVDMGEVFERQARAHRAVNRKSDAIQENDNCVPPLSEDIDLSGHDLFQQLSTDLNLPDFMEDDASSSSSSAAARTESLYDMIMTENTGAQSNVFSDLGSSRTEDMISPDSMSLKSEPYSPTPTVQAFPPSPSGSDHSSSSTASSENKDAIVILSTNGTTIPLSPPYSPPTANGGQRRRSSSTYQVVTPVTNANMTQQVMVNQGGSIVAVSDLTNLKLPIPKVVKPAPAPVRSVLNQPLVLTTNQLTQLQNGVLRVTSAGPVVSPSASTTSNAPIVIKTEPTGATNNPMLTAMPTVQAMSFTQQSNGGTDVDMKTLKRQQRMIKNRESACQSRKKKKEYVSNLEEQIKLLNQANKALSEENEALKAKVRELESEKNLWTDTVLNGSNMKKATALFACLLVISLNASSLGGAYNKNLGGKADPLMPNLEVPLSAGSSVHHGRSLLWVNDTLEENVLPANLSSPICPMYFNQSESIRLDNQLRGWFSNDISKEKKERVVPSQAVPQQKRKLNELPSTSLGQYRKPKVQSLTGGMYHMLLSEQNDGYRRTKPEERRDSITPRGNMAELSLYNSEVPRFTYESFFEAIDRKDDTFYVVSFSGDHLLLPASAHNQTSRPRMSLLLPAFASLNESMKAPPNHVAMMQIDCQVMNTRLIHVKEDAIPLHMSAHMKRDGDGARNASAAQGFGNQTLRAQHDDEGFGDFENRIYGPESAPLSTRSSGPLAPVARSETVSSRKGSSGTTKSKLYRRKIDKTKNGNVTRPN